MSKKFVVIDEIMDMLEAAKSGVVPGSVTQSVVSSSQNVPQSVYQHSMAGGGNGAAYLTFPISPIQDNCCIDKTYVNFEFDYNFDIVVKNPVALAEHDVLEIPYFFGHRDPATLPKQLTIMIENSPLYNTTYQRQEATVAYCAMPEEAIRGNSQYASIEKMILNKRSPMKRLVAKYEAPGVKNVDDLLTIHQTVHVKMTQDLDSLTPLLSNLHFTTPHMGNLRVREYFQDMQNALFFCPDYNWMNNNKAGLTEIDTAAKINAGIDAAIAQPTFNQYWSFYPLADFANVEIASTKIPFYVSYVKADKSVMQVYIAKSVKFTDPTDPNTPDFMTFRAGTGGVAEIVQTNFKIRAEEYDRLTQYFAGQGAIIIPTQTWATSVFNNSVQQKDNWATTMIGTVGGYNIDFISVWARTKSAAAFNWEPLTDIQLLLDGRPINALPYEFVNDKCITDSCQAIIDTDHEEINHDYVASLNWMNETGTRNYMAASPHTTYGAGAIGSSIKTRALYNPNLFCLNFSTNLPNAFHSGACTLESANRQGTVRFNSTNKASTSGDVVSADRASFPYFISNANLSASTGDQEVGFCAFCDCCLVLNFDATRNRAFDGSLSWAAPYE